MHASEFRRPVGWGKGRQVDPAALQRVRALVDGLPPRRDLLVEHLHRIQDAEGCLPAPLLAALAEWLGLAQTEVYEVASFYHHFEPLREGEARPAALTVRVCDSLPCRLNGAEALLTALALMQRDGLLMLLSVPCALGSLLWVYLFPKYGVIAAAWVGEWLQGVLPWLHF